ncbi:uncharacterized protein LOC134677253 [Cydia fagiglandana]|uniref:uncharacterized protein LOC134669905 n=1 Tax=Cydia fagiglandana TaxID=1458189 RepID=UPI002FEDF030
MVLLSASPCGLARLITVCEQYAAAHGLKYNSVKSEMMVFGVRGKCPSTVPVLQLNNNPLKLVDNFKYLGHMITSDLKDGSDVERERRALAVRANMIARRFACSSPAVKITLFRAFCTSFYTSSLWVNYTQKQYSALRVQYNNAFRVLMGLPRYCSASTMFAEARVDSFAAIMRKRATSLLCRVRNSTNSILAMYADRFDGAYLNHCGALHMCLN